MNVPSHRQVTHLDLAREEQWLLHHVMLDRMELEARAPAEADPPPLGVFQVFEKLEAGTHEFSPVERARIATELRRYVDTANVPDRDRSVAHELLDRLEEPDAGRDDHPGAEHTG